MTMLSGVSTFFGLDIGTSSVRLVELRGSGPVKALVRYGSIEIDPRISVSESDKDLRQLQEAIKELLGSTGVGTQHVAVNLPSDKVFTTVADLDRVSESELAKTIKFQADALIPTPINESKIDWALLGDSPKEKTKIEVLLTSVSNKFLEKRLDMLEAIGLNVIAFESDNLALSRAIVSHDATVPQMVLDIGEKNTDLVILMNGAPRLTRSIPTGSEALVRAAVQNLNIDDAQARQFVFKFGLAQDKLEGQVHQAIIGTVDLLISEIEKSIKFFNARYGDVKLDRVIMTGWASALPEFPLYVANKFGLNVEIGSAWRNVSYSADRQNELMSVSNHFGVAAGLAERNE